MAPGTQLEVLAPAQVTTSTEKVFEKLSDRFREHENNQMMNHIKECTFRFLTADMAEQ